MTAHHNLHITRFLPGEADTLALGSEIARGLAPGMVIYLSGDLGTGKTTLARGILRAAGVRERIKSPTYTLVELYTVSSLYFYHFDFYRLTKSGEWMDAGLREHFNAESVCIVEWPEKADGHLPRPDVRISMEVSGGGRSVTVTAETEAGRKCSTRLQT